MGRISRKKRILLIGLILLLGGIGVYGAGGFVRPVKKEKIKLPKKKGNRVRQMIGLGCTVLAVALIFFYLYDTKIRIAQNTTERVTILESDGETQKITEENAYY